MTNSYQGRMPDWLDAAARSYPKGLALSFGSERWSFAELRRAVDGAAGVLATVHRARGGRIGILAANRPGFVFAVHAARRLGVPVVPLNWRQTSDELAWQLRDAGVGVLVVDDMRESVAAAAAEGLDISVVPIATLELASAVAPKSGSPPSIDLNGEAAVLYTSGTSGRPKGARLTYGNLWSSAVASALYLGHHRDDAWLAAMPLFHVGGLSILVRGVIGMTPVILHERFDAERVLAALDTGVTLISVVPTMLRQLIDRRGSPWPASVRCVLLGGSAAPAGLVEECLWRGIPVAPTYGLTEAASQVTTLLPDEAAAHLGSSGRPLPLTEVRIAGVGGLADAGETGEIEVRGPTVFAGYLHGVASEGRPSPPCPATQKVPGPLRPDTGRYWLEGRSDAASEVRPHPLTRHPEGARPIPMGEGERPRGEGDHGHSAPCQTPRWERGNADFTPIATTEEVEVRGEFDGWFRTGDAGYLDEEGYLYVVDRRDDLIVSGGENVYPAEIERVLLSHLMVRDAAVIGVPDATWGTRPVAMVVWTGDANAAEAELLAHCRARLAAFKVPRRVLVRDELPRSASGKLLRRKLRDALLREGGEGA